MEWSLILGEEAIGIITMEDVLEQLLQVKLIIHVGYVSFFLLFLNWWSIANLSAITYFFSWKEPIYDETDDYVDVHNKYVSNICLQYLNQECHDYVLNNTHLLFLCPELGSTFLHRWYFHLEDLQEQWQQGLLIINRSGKVQ